MSVDGGHVGEVRREGARARSMLHGAPSDPEKRHRSSGKRGEKKRGGKGEKKAGRGPRGGAEEERGDEGTAEGEGRGGKRDRKACERARIGCVCVCVCACVPGVCVQARSFLRLVVIGPC